MVHRTATTALLGVLISSGAPVTSQPAAAPVLVELFTSEGCSSCPAADELLAALSRDQPIAGAFVVALGEHVDYWDHQGWRDRFGSPLFTRRQEMYARRFNLHSIYTPQMVVDGAGQLVGSDRKAADREIRAAARASKPRIEMTASPGDGQIRIGFAAAPIVIDGDSADLVIALTEDALSSRVTAGENARRTLSHVAVARYLAAREVKAAAGEPRAVRALDDQVVKADPSWRLDAMRAVTFLQSRKTGRVLALGWTTVTP